MASYTLNTTDQQETALTWEVGQVNAAAQVAYVQAAAVAASQGLPAPDEPIPYTNTTYLQERMDAVLNDYIRQYNDAQIPAPLTNLDMVKAAYVNASPENQQIALTALGLSA